MRRCTFFLFLTTILTAQSVKEVELTAEPHHQLVFENAQVRVFNVDVSPHTDTLMHWHHHDYIYVMLGASEVVNAVKGKDPVTAKLQDGQAGFAPGNFAHIVHNGSQPFRNLTIELRQDDRLHKSSPHWDPAHPDEDRGLDILHGGTKEILFVKDGVRVSQLELQPGGMVPTHHHAGPHLVVALTDYELRSDVEGKPPVTVTMKRGEIKWVQGGFSHTLTNTGKTQAKFVTLEFH
jgi:oxalate decarboxylase/phosphoglucose isomerase-like protein (cupin superfamily)